MAEVLTMDRRELVLAVLASSNGRPFTPVQLQKAVFLVTRNLPRLVSKGPKFNFRAYDYGPFDADVYDEARILTADGDVLITPSGSGPWNTYAATDDGVEDGKRLLKALPRSAREYIERTSRWVRSQSFSGLVKSIYDAYPEMRANSVFRG